jgi:hypothetical protein
MERVLLSHWLWAVIIKKNCNTSSNKCNYLAQNPLLLVTEPQIYDSFGVRSGYNHKFATVHYLSALAVGCGSLSSLSCSWQVTLKRNQCFLNVCTLAAALDTNPYAWLQSLPLLMNWTTSSADSVENGQVWKQRQHYCKLTLRINWTWQSKKSLFPPSFFSLPLCTELCAFSYWKIFSLQDRPTWLSGVERHISASVPGHTVCVDVQLLNIRINFKQMQYVFMLMQDQIWSWHDYKNHSRRPSWCSIKFKINKRLSLWFSTGCPIYIILFSYSNYIQIHLHILR